MYLVGFIVSALAIAGFISAISPLNFLVALISCFIIGSGIVIPAIVSRDKAKKRQEADRQREAAFTYERTLNEVSKIIDEHIETLGRRRLALVKSDHYGVEDRAEWTREVAHFMDKVIAPRIPDATTYSSTIERMIDDAAQSKAEAVRAELQFSPNMTPTDFEVWCSQVLTANGWRARTTKASGDQGADVLAEKKGLRIVLQCKLYSSQIGNKAVQEAFAAKTHYGTNIACVVTNGGFTKAARQLAATTGVFLLNHTDLSRFDEILNTKGIRATMADDASSPTPCGAETRPSYAPPHALSELDQRIREARASLSKR